MKGWRRVKPWRVWDWVALAARGWLGPWVALAGLINEGMEEGEPWPPSGLGRFGRKGLAGAGASLWPDLLMKGWRRVSLGHRLGWAALAARGWLGQVRRFGRTY